MAIRFLISAGTGNWNSTTNWAASSGGASGASFPVAGDTAVFDAGSANAGMTINVASATAIFSATSAYAGTLGINNSLTTTSTIVLGSGMTLTASSTSNALIFGTTGAALTSNGKTWPCSWQVGLGSSATYTLNDSWTLLGNLVINGNSNVTQTLNGNTINIAKTLQIGISFLNTVAGTTILNMNGTGNINCNNNGVIKSSLTLNTAGNITLSVTTNYNTGTFLITSVGSLITTNNTLNLGANSTLTVNTSNISFDNLTLNGTPITINGTNGFTTNNFTCSTAGVSVTWKNGNTYIINSVLTLAGTAASNITFVSSTPGTQYKFILSNNGTASPEDVSFVNCTDAYSGGGLTIWDYKGTISNTNNWNAPQNSVQNNLVFSNS